LHKENFQAELNRATNLCERYLLAVTDRDRVSRLYYACYHVAIAAINLVDDYDKLKRTNERCQDTGDHQKLQIIYPTVFGTPTKDKSKKFKIVAGNYNTGNALRDWSKLRNNADYDVFVDVFDKKLENTLI